MNWIALATDNPNCPTWCNLGGSKVLQTASNYLLVTTASYPTILACSFTISYYITLFNL